MRIAWFIPRYHPCIGGAEAYGRAMVRRFIAAGHEVDVHTSDAHELWYFTDPRRRRVDAPSESVVDGARVRRHPIRHFPGQRYVRRLLSYVPHFPAQCRWASYLPLIPTIERVRAPYDAVFAVGFPYTVFSYAAMRTARAAGAPLILTPFLHLATPGDAVNRHYTRPHQVRLLRAADLVVSPTDLESRTLEAMGIPRARRLVLPMAIERAEVTGGDGPRFRARLNLPPGRPVVGQLGALDPNKGTNDLVRAALRLNADRPDGDPVHLVLAGASSPDFEAFVAQLPAQTGRWLTVLGPLPPADVPSFYAALDVFAMPSRTDSFGIVFLEAWANALPVIAAAAGGVVDVVADGRTGLLVPFGAPDRLADTLGRLLTDRELARRLGRNGFAQVSQAEYTWDDRYERLVERIEGLIAARRRGAPTPHSGPVRSRALPADRRP